MLKSPTRMLGSVALGLGLAACGSTPFTATESSSGGASPGDANALVALGTGSSTGTGSETATATSTEAATATATATSTAAATGTASATATAAASATATSTAGGSSSSTTPNVPGAAAGDLSAIDACLQLWGTQSPFANGQPIQNYQKISASISIGGFGSVINDTQQTAEPELVLVDASVAVLGAPTYNLENHNGWYCMKVGVDVLTHLTVNLDCEAHLADSRVNVNVLSNQNNTTSAVGVEVLSSVQVNNVQSTQGETCIR